MCGRYRRTTREEELARIYHIPTPKQTDLPISYNIAPSQKVLTIRFNPETRARSLNALQWGLIPYWRRIQRSLTGPSMRELRRSIKHPRIGKLSRNGAAWFQRTGFTNGAKRLSRSCRSRSPCKTDARSPLPDSGKTGRSRILAVAAHLHDYHRRTKRVGGSDPHANAGDFT
jgi:SOS response associated peptidase (SRAP)